MKKTLLFSFLLLAFFAKAQNEVLIDNLWYLQKVIVEDMEYPTPINSENSEVSLQIGEGFFMTGVCNAMGGDLEFHQTEDILYISNISVTLMDCELTENFEFENLYFWEFFYVGGALVQAYDYSIAYIDDYIELTISNPVGVVAIYHNQNTVSIPEISKNEISVFPNPASERMAISFPPLTEEAQIQILDIYGKTISDQVLLKNQTQFIWDCADRSAGFYFYQITIGGNKTSGKLMVK
jgi:hypothetical protein